jgi:hypothetical protein
MRFRTLLPILVAGTAFAAAGPRITPNEAESHRAQLVTLTGVVSEVRSGADGVVLRVGTDPAVSVLVPQSARGRFKPDPTELHQKAIEVTGFLTPPGRPLAIVVERQEDLRRDTSTPADPETLLRERVRALEVETERLRPLHPTEEVEGGITLGPVMRPLRPLPPYATQAMVLAEHGVPTRVDWSNGKRVLMYGRERWTFDARGQLVDVRDY